MTSEEYTQKRRNAYRRARTKVFADAGLCTVCGKHPALPGRKRCAECAHASSERNKRAYKTRAAQTKELYYQRKESGLCVRCGAPAVKRRTMCQYHLDLEKQRRAERKAREAEEEARWLSEC